MAIDTWHVPFLVEPRSLPEVVLVLTPDRRRSMKWADVDLESGWWSIPGAVAKNGQVHRVPLTKTAVDILKARLKTAGGGAPFVFENRRGTGSVAHRGKKAASILCKSPTVKCQSWRRSPDADAFRALPAIARG